MLYQKEKRKGQAMVEFAFAFMVFAVLIMGIIQFFLVVQNKAAVESAAHFALRKAAVVQIQATNYCAQAQERARDAFVEFMSMMSNGFDPSMFRDDMLEVDCSGQRIQVGQLWMYPLEVSVSYPMKLIFPMGVSTITLEARVPGAFERMSRVNN